MMKHKTICIKKHITKLFCLILATLMLVGTGCGQKVSYEEEIVELVEPVGVAFRYETAQKHNLYESKTYSAILCPYTEEYELTSWQVFEGYDSYPGDQVSTGGVLLHSNTKDLDDKISDKQKYINQMEDEYQEFVVDNRKEYWEVANDKVEYEAMVKELEATEPAKYVDVTDPVTGQTTKKINGDYNDWYKYYKMYDGSFRNASLSIDRLEQAYKERNELYALDLAYQQKLLKRIQEDKLACTLRSKMNGVVVALKYLDNGNGVNSEVPLVAVGDMNRLELKSEYINKGAINKAKDVYAIVNGKRYEVEYQPIDTDEYKRLNEKNGKVYSTFLLDDPEGEVAVGSFASIIIVTRAAEDVLAVRRDSVKVENGGSYVNVVVDNQSVHRPVKTGMSDGIYTEIVSGLEEGEKVLTENATNETVKNTSKLSYGSLSYNFNSTGYMYYPANQLISSEVTYGTCYFVENQVKQYQQVKKGDTLATVRVVADSVELSRNETKLQREKERLADLKKGDLEKNKKAIASKEKIIADLEKLIKEMKADFAVKEIKAPINGIVTSINNYEEGSLLKKGDGLFLLSDDTKSYIFVEDQKGMLTYGNEVEITYKDTDGGDKKERVTTGTVVTVNQTVLSKSMFEDNEMTTGWNQKACGALVMVSTEDIGKMAAIQSEEGWWSRVSFKVRAQTRSMDNVLVIPKSAVTDNQGTTYVRIKNENGEVVSKSFIAGGSDTSYYWVAEGLTEGMELCLE